MAAQTHTPNKNGYVYIIGEYITGEYIEYILSGEPT